MGRSYDKGAGQLGEGEEHRDRLWSYLSTDSELGRNAAEQLRVSGYVVLPGVLTDAEADAEYSRLWDFVESVSGKAVSRHKPRSWYPESSSQSDPWPCSQRDMFQHHQAGWLLSDLREKVVERVFEPLYGGKALHVSKDGFTLQRPTSEDHKLNRTHNDHFDQGNTFFGLQCIQGSVALTDQVEEDGCFQVWPGSHEHREEVLSGTASRSDFVIMNERQREMLTEGKGIRPVRVPVRKGTAILWRSDCAHCGGPPVGLRPTFRGVAYVCALPACLTPEAVYEDKERSFADLQTGSHWPNREEWFAPRGGKSSNKSAAVAPEKHPFFKPGKPPKLSPRQQELYGLVRYSKGDIAQQEARAAAARALDAGAADGAGAGATQHAVLARTRSEEYGRGASRYTDEDLAEWKELGKRGQEAWKSKKYDEAATVWRAMISLRPDFVTTYLNLRRCLKRLGEPDVAVIDMLEDALIACFESPELHRLTAAMSELTVVRGVGAELDEANDLAVDPLTRPYFKADGVTPNFQAIRQCYDEHGTCAITGILSPQEVEELITQGLDPLLPDGCSMLDPESFHLADHTLTRFGVLATKPLFNRALLQVRCNERIANAYRAVYGRDDVVCCHDSAAWMRPAASNPSWDTPFSWPGLHFDVSLRGYYEFGKSELSEWQQTALDYSEPSLGGFRSENNGQVEEAGRCVQGTLSLFDNNEEDGGFHCVPGCFKDRLKEWVQRAEKESPGWFPEPEVNGRYNMRSFGPDIEIGSMTQRVPCPAGTLTLFDATLPHGTKPNASAKSRAIIFLRYLPSDALPASVWTKRNRSLKRVVDREGFVPNQREAQVLFGPQF